MMADAEKKYCEKCDKFIWTCTDVCILCGAPLRTVHIREIDTASGTELKVCLDIMTRQQMGVEKYGTTVEDNPLTLREWLQHAYEECLDQAIYLRRSIEELDKGGETTERSADNEECRGEH